MLVHRIRQNLGVQAPTTLAGGQLSPVTVYSIPQQVGATAEIVIKTYTQTFANVLDQFPAPVAGTIGMGQWGKEKREAIPTPAPEPQTVNTGIAGRIRP